MKLICILNAREKNTCATFTAVLFRREKNGGGCTCMYRLELSITKGRECLRG